MPDSIGYIGKFLILAGVIAVALGGLLLLFRHSAIPFSGKLPGDIIIQKKNFTFYFPFTTGIILSIILSLILWLFGRK